MVSFDTLLRQSDFVFVACPLNNETRNMFDKNAFSKMKSNSVFVNVARGGIVVQDDLIDALRNGTIFSAGLDVMTPEPLPSDHILTTLDNCGKLIRIMDYFSFLLAINCVHLVIIPHLGSATNKTRGDMAIVAAQNILNALDGKPMIYSAY